MTEHDRKILERIVEQGCGFITCRECPVQEGKTYGFCTNETGIEDTKQYIKKLLAKDARLTREDVEEICLEQIAKYLEKDEKPEEQPKEQPEGIEQLFIDNSVWKNLITETVYTIFYTTGNEVRWDDDSYCYYSEVSENNILIDTGKVPIAKHAPPEGVPFMGFWDNTNAYLDFMIKDGVWCVREDSEILMIPGNYVVPCTFECPEDYYTHWQISGAMAVTAMQILRGE